jgi:hypothetical protein
MWFPPPQRIQIGPAYAARQQIILLKARDGIPPLKVAKATKVTLEQGQKVIPVPSYFKAGESFWRSPVETIVVRHHMAIKMV